jgi:hypothetical protein
MYDLLSNALTSVRNGVDDFATGNPDRTSSALRNLHAGVMLLLKEVLRRASPPGSEGALMFAKVKAKKTETGEIIWVPDGTLTLGPEELVRRYQSLGIELDQKRLRRLTDIRNHVEHHKAIQAVATMQAAMASVFVLVENVLRKQLGLEPAVVLGDAWRTMLTAKELFEDVEKRCRTSRDRLKDTPESARHAVEECMRCPECDSALVSTTAETLNEDAMFKCEVCNESCALERILPPALERAYLGWGARHHHDDPSDDPPICECPSCWLAAFSTEEDRCLVCGETRPYKECGRCGERLGLSEQDGGLCGYCEHMMFGRDD